MAISLAFYKVLKLDIDNSDGLTITRNSFEEENNLEPIRIKYARNRTLNNKQYVEYSVDYDSLINQDGHIFLDDGTFHSFEHFYSKRSFNAFYDSKNSFITFTCPSKHSDSMLKEMKSLMKNDLEDIPDESKVALIKQPIDLALLATRGARQAWFRLSSDTANAASIIGSNIITSDLYENLTTRGTHSSITVTIDLNGVPYSCIVSAKGSIYIQTSVTEDNAILIMEKIKGILNI